MKKIAVVFVALFMIAALAQAQHGPMGAGHGPEGEHGPGGPGGPGGGAIVGSDGTIYVPSVTVDTTANTATMTIKAVSPSGSVLWTATLSNPGHATLSDGNLVVESAARASDGTITTTLTAIATASGATAWTKTLNGHAQLFPFSGGVYALVIVPPATQGGTPTRSLVGISNSGSTLFTLAL
jgi:hypothetical protein